MLPLDWHGNAEIQNMKEKCKEMEETLEHRYFKITTGLRNFQSNNKPEDQEPERPMRYQRISQLMNCFDDDEYQSLLLRQQDQFKCF